MLTLFRKTGIIHDPGHHSPLLLHGRQYLFTQHDPVGIGHSMEPSPLGGAMIDAWLERYSDLAAPPLAQCSCARRATANPCNNPSAVRVGLGAPRRSPSPQYMPRSASPVGLARRVLRPQNNSTPDCCLYDPVILDHSAQCWRALQEVSEANW